MTEIRQITDVLKNTCVLVDINMKVLHGNECYQMQSVDLGNELKLNLILQLHFGNLLCVMGIGDYISSLFKFMLKHHKWTENTSPKPLHSHLSLSVKGQHKINVDGFLSSNCCMVQQFLSCHLSLDLKLMIDHMKQCFKLVCWPIPYSSNIHQQSIWLIVM